MTATSEERVVCLHLFSGNLVSLEPILISKENRSQARHIISKLRDLINDQNSYQMRYQKDGIDFGTSFNSAIEHSREGGHMVIIVTDGEPNDRQQTLNGSDDTLILAIPPLSTNGEVKSFNPITLQHLHNYGNVVPINPEDLHGIFNTLDSLSQYSREKMTLHVMSEAVDNAYDIYCTGSKTIIPIRLNRGNVRLMLDGGEPVEISFSSLRPKTWIYEKHRGYRSEYASQAPMSFFSSSGVRREATDNGAQGARDRLMRQTSL